ncbi:MAG: hypothetical protein IKO68_04670 [Oscillospiraceae bacterium]|nr:hypothetical protein [Oscillospiraceae bacterium]
MSDWNEDENYDSEDEIIEFLIFEEIMREFDEEKNKGKKSKDGCYIATCVYGSYDAPEVLTLRHFRDTVLRQNPFGRLFIRVYYALSPGLVYRFGSAAWFHRFWKRPLDRFVKSLRRRDARQ